MKRYKAMILGGWSVCGMGDESTWVKNWELCSYGSKYSALMQEIRTIRRLRTVDRNISAIFWSRYINGNQNALRRDGKLSLCTLVWCDASVFISRMIMCCVKAQLIKTAKATKCLVNLVLCSQVQSQYHLHTIPIPSWRTCEPSWELPLTVGIHQRINKWTKPQGRVHGTPL